MKPRKVDLFKPNNFTAEWLKELKKTFQSGMIAQAGKVEEFEKLFCGVFDYKYAAALNSGTAALEMAYHLVGIEPGDKVLTPVLTCTATNIPLVHRGAKIEFVDIDKGMTMDYEDFLRKVDSDTKAIVVVNLGGLYTDKRIFARAKEMNIPVIIDAAQQLGLGLGMQGDYICYSFQAIKHFTTGDGGMIVVRSEQELERAKQLRWFGIDRDRRRKMNFEFSPSEREMCMNMDEPGFKTHMNDIQATMGIVGLEHTWQSMVKRAQITDIYKRKLEKKIECVYGGSLWLFCIMLDDRDAKMDLLKAAGVGNDLVHLRNDIFTPFGLKRLPLPNMAEIEDRYLYIPIHTKMSKADANYVANVILEVI